MLPNLSDYMQTFQNPQYFLTDQTLASCRCPKDQQGQPLVQSGGFALTFKLEGENKWAVRCFHREVNDRDTRYSIITRKLKEPSIQQSGYFLEFEYQPEGVVVKSKRYPIVKMAWAKGETLGTFLEKNYNNKTYLLNLKKALIDLASFLKSNGIAHGDIQPSNIMVSNEGKRLQLIDYDGMFVPGMEQLSASETGVPNFQHPKRGTTNPWNDKLDRFPFIIFDIALTILSNDPEYWTKTNSSDEKILFETTDYIAPLGSALFNELKANPNYSQTIAALQKICLADFELIPTVDDYAKFNIAQTTDYNSQPIEIWYKGNHPVVNAVDITNIQKHDGDVVEIVGQICEVKRLSTRNKRPYCFINFRPWAAHQTSFRIVLWSTVLKQFADMGIPSVEERFKNRYISLTGLLVKFTNENGTSYQIIPSNANSISIIDHEEFSFRLNEKAKKIRTQFGRTLPAQNICVPKNNVDKLRGITVASKQSKPRQTNTSNKSQIQQRGVTSYGGTPSTRSTSNMDKLKSATTPSYKSSQNSTPSYNRPPRLNVTPTSNTSSNTSKNSSSNGCIIILIIAFVLFLLLSCG